MAKKILVIEDDKLMLDLLERKLKEYNYSVKTDSEGISAIAKAKDFLPDLIILDIEVVQKPGLEILKEISQDMVLNKIPVISIFNSGETEEFLQAQKLGVRDWIIKVDFDLDELIDKVIKQIGK